MVFQFRCFSKYIQTVFIQQAFKEINTIRQPLPPQTFITGIWDLTFFLVSLRRFFSTHAFLLLSFQSQDFTSWQHGQALLLLIPATLFPHLLLTSALLDSNFLPCSFPSSGGSPREWQWPGTEDIRIYPPILCVNQRQYLSLPFPEKRKSLSLQKLLATDEVLLGLKCSICFFRYTLPSCNFTNYVTL